jgi:uncharacterized protein (DUF427 family)
MKAIWNNQVISDSNDTIIVEGYHYFPLVTVKKEYLQPSDTNTTYLWKGLASYYTLQVHGNTYKNATWFYSQPKEAVKQIKDHIAFRCGVKVEP